MSTPSFDIFDQLLSLITQSTQTIKQEYVKKSWDPPSLDSPEPHPMELEKPSFEMKKAIQLLEGACAQLTLTVSDRYHTTINRAMGVFEVACLHVVTEAKIADYLEEAGPNGLSAEELSNKSGINEGKLARVLRFLATQHVFREVKKGYFANNRFSDLLRNSNEMSSLLLFFADYTKSAGGFLDNLKHPLYGNSYLPAQASLPRAFGLPDDANFFTWINDFDVKRGKCFGRGMIALGKACSGDLVKVFPWTSLSPGSIICDIGGGLGHASMELARIYSQFKFIVQDLPKTIVQGRELWLKGFPEAVKSQQVSFFEIDFFKNVPVEDCDVYYLRHIIHDWPDKDCLTILKNVCAAMKPGSKLLIHDYILQYPYRVPETEALTPQAPEPLLPNYGYGSARPFALDIALIMALNSKERTLDEFIDLGKKGGLTFVKVYDTGESGILEFEVSSTNAAQGGAP